MDIQQITPSLGNNFQQSSNAAVATRPASDVGTSQSSAPSVKVPADAVQAVTQPTDANQLKHAVESVNKVVQALNNQLEFSIDQDTGIHVVKVVDLATKDVIRQIPSKEMIAIAESIDKLQGLLVKEKV